MSDYYQILNLKQGATKTEIKDAYKKLAKEHHPDKGGDEAYFTKIKDAYKMLYEHTIDTESGLPQPQGGPEIPQGQQQINPDLLNFLQQQQSVQIVIKDTIEEFEIELKDVYFGLTLKKTLTRTSLCTECRSVCLTCNGTSVIQKMVQNGIFLQLQREACNSCNEVGYKSTGCSSCEETGIKTETEDIDLCIPKAVEDGQEITFVGWGPYNEILKTRGKYIVKIKIKENPIFKRDGIGLIYNPEITFRNSIMGSIISIPLFDEELKYNTEVLGIINPFMYYVLENKGLEDASGNRGPLIIQFKIRYPDSTFRLNPTQRSTINQILEEANTYTAV